MPNEIHEAMLADFAKHNLMPAERIALAHEYLKKARAAWLVGDIEDAFCHYTASLYLGADHA